MSEVFGNRNKDEKPAAPAAVPASIPAARGAAVRPRPAAAPASRPADTRNRAPATGGGGRQLVVGREISLSGEIKDCEQLIVEGRVEAALIAGDLLVVSDGGLFRGPADVRSAEIDGAFEGELTVHDKLVVKPSGRIDGKIRYRVLEVQPGAQIMGALELLPPEA